MRENTCICTDETARSIGVILRSNSVPIQDKVYMILLLYRTRYNAIQVRISGSPAIAIAVEFALNPEQTETNTGLRFGNRHGLSQFC